MNLIKTVLLLIFLTQSLWSSSQALIPQKAQQDQITSKIWKAFGPDLKQITSSCHEQTIIEELSDQTGISSTTLRVFLKYSSSYPHDSIRLSQVLYRFPHYSGDSITVDLTFLVDEKLLLKRDHTEGWPLSDLGKDLLNKYWGLKTREREACRQLDSVQLNNALVVLEKIINESQKVAISRSVNLRMMNRPSNFYRFPTELKLAEYQKDLSAFINDVGHHRFDQFLSSTPSPEWQGLEISGLARELLGATRNQRRYELSRCYNQPNWRVGQAACDSAVIELAGQNLVALIDQSITQTEKGARLFAEADSLADAQLYSIWNGVTPQEYDNLLGALEWISNSVKLK